MPKRNIPALQHAAVTRKGLIVHFTNGQAALLHPAKIYSLVDLRSELQDSKGREKQTDSARLACLEQRLKITTCPRCDELQDALTRARKISPVDHSAEQECHDGGGRQFQARIADALMQLIKHRTRCADWLQAIDRILA